MANEKNLKRGNSPETQFNSRTAAEAAQKSAQKKREKRSIREAMQALLDNTYNITDKKSGEVRKLNGEQAIALSIMNTAMNPKDKNWKAAVQYALQLTGEDKSENENKVIELHAKKLQAEVDLLTGADTSTMDKLDNILDEMKKSAFKDGEE